MTAVPRIPVVVTEVAEITPLVKRFRFKARSGEPLPQFAGGAHVHVEMHDGDIVRRNPYSLMSPPAETSTYTISVRRDDKGRGGSRFMHEQIAVGSELHIGYPVNLFPIDYRAKKHLLIAGGIGITPFMAIIAQLGADSLPFELHYGVRSQTDGAYAGYLTERYPGRVHIYHQDQDRMVPTAALLAHQPLGTHLYVCGPGAMIENVVQTARDAGWPDQTIHFERFLAPASGEPYEIYLKASDKTVRVGSHQSMLEAIEAAGIDAPFLCRGGACGQCETDVLECDGKLLHNDHFLSEEDKASGKKVMPCVSRFEGRRLVLDR